MDELDQLLIGQTLEGGWVVQEPRHVQRDAPSASRAYLASNSQGTKAFVKVLDPRANGSLQEAQNNLSQFIYEHAIVDVCAERNMHRVIRGLEYGILKTPEPFSVSLHYLVFEWAPCDLRSQIDLDERSHLAVVLRWLHHVATGLQQLHFSDIAHQDVKPANILVMENQSAKLGDLGRAHRHAAPMNYVKQERDPTYAAPELLYGGIVNSFDDRCAADMYAFGGLVFFLVSGTSLNAELTRELAGMHHWSVWTGTFEDATPYVRRAFETVMHRAVANLDPSVADRLAPVMRQLCDPEPLHRGHPANRSGDGAPYGMQRFVSAFDLLAKGAEWRRNRVA
jgi:serine/threonine protein kinase